MRVGGLEYTRSPACSALWQTSTLHLQIPVILTEGWHKKSCKRLASPCSHLPDSLPVRSVPWALEPVAWQCPLSTPGVHTPCWGHWLLLSATVAGLCRVQSYVVALQVVTTVPPPYPALMGFRYLQSGVRRFIMLLRLYFLTRHRLYKRIHFHASKCA